MSNKLNYYITSCLVALLFIATLYIIQPILSPLAVAAIVAYLLNPCINKLEKYKLPRSCSVLLVLFTFLMLFLTFLVIVAPIAYVQLISLLRFLINEKIPLIKDQIMPALLKIYEDMTNLSDAINIMNNLPENLFESHTIITFLSSISKIIKSLITNALSSSIDLINTLVLVFITIILLFYMLYDRPSIIRSINNLIPISYREIVKSYFIQIDSLISAYLRGQVSVCLIMAIFYSIGLKILNMNYWLLTGLISGIMTFIPYIGSFSCTVLALLIAISQFDTLFMYLAVLSLFIVGQAIEGMVITPFLIGKKVKLHPIWIIIGMTICASQIGFLGILFSIPITAISCVFIKAIVNSYISSEFYNKSKCS